VNGLIFGIMLRIVVTIQVLVNAPLDKLPLFIKKDTILPWGELKESYFI
jgi:alpha-glucosidase (family GH31 glycosyl hydrolase)